MPRDTKKRRRSTSSSAKRNTDVSIPRTVYTKMSQPKIYKFRRTLQQHIPINQFLGFNSVGTSLAIAPMLSACTFWINGAIVYQPVMPGVAELQSLFDVFKIRKVSYEIYFSNNESGVNAPNTILPLLHFANDYNDVATAGLTEIQQYPGMVTYQLGKERRIKWSVYPRVRLDTNQDPSGSLTGLAAFNTTGYLDTSASGSGVMHLGTKIVMNNLQRLTNVDLGNIVILCTYDLEFKNVR